jgi:hypothetical protein
MCLAYEYPGIISGTAGTLFILHGKELNPWDSLTNGKILPAPPKAI